MLLLLIKFVFVCEKLLHLQSFFADFRINTSNQPPIRNLIRRKNPVFLLPGFYFCLVGRAKILILKQKGGVNDEFSEKTAKRALYLLYVYNQERRAYLSEA